MRGVLDLALAFLILLFGTVLFFVAFFGVNRQQSEFVQLVNNLREQSTGYSSLTNTSYDHHLTRTCQRGINDPGGYVQSMHASLSTIFGNRQDLVVGLLLYSANQSGQSGNFLIEIQPQGEHQEFLTTLSNYAQANSCHCVVGFSIGGIKNFECCNSAHFEENQTTSCGSGQQCSTDECCVGGQCVRSCESNSACTGSRQACIEIDGCWYCQTCPVSYEPDENTGCKLCDPGEECGCQTVGQGRVADGSGGCNACGSGYTASVDQQSCVQCNPPESCNGSFCIMSECAIGQRYQYNF
ncbi:MAG: hypothetical protein N2654_00230 [Deltaproteobacteria bacterium]|nr:hypothetical protein [Deltaproteobacteria bacterium]